MKGVNPMSFLRTFTLCIIGCLSLMVPGKAIADSNTVIHWGIPSSQNHQTPDPGAQLKEITEKYHAIYMGDPKQKHLYLTFDCGYENGQTSKILDVLKKEKVPATFFVTGLFVRTQPELVKRMANEGHIIGNHTWHHPNLTSVNHVRFEKELNLLQNEVKSITGIPSLNYLRPPEGIFSEKSLRWGNDLGYTQVFWSLAYLDWDVKSQKGEDYAYSQIMRRLHSGAVMLLHSISKDNADALQRVIIDAKKEGYTFKSLDDLVMSQSTPKPFQILNR